MNDLQLEIARFLVKKAASKMRTTYKEVGENIGWNHPTGRGLGDHLHAILVYCKSKNLPPLTSIVVKRGQRIPSPDAGKYFQEVLGDIDFEEAQKQVFLFDWSTVSKFSSTQENDCLMDS